MKHFSAAPNSVYLEARIVQETPEVNKIVKKVRAVPAHEVDGTSIVSAEEFPEVRQDDFFIHSCILYGQGISAQVPINGQIGKLGTSLIAIPFRSAESGHTFV